MTQNRDLRATVGYKVDQQSIAAATQANTKVAVSFGGVQIAASEMSAEFLKLNPQIAAMVSQANSAAAVTQTLAQTQSLVATNASRLTSSLNSQKAPVQDLTALYKGLEDQARRAGVAQDIAANSGGGGLPGRNIGGSGISSGFGTVRSLAGAAGLVAGNSQAGSTIAAFAGLASVLGPVGIGVAAVGLGFRAVTEQTERITTATKARLDAETKLQKQLEDATRAQAVEALADAQEALAFANRRRAEIAGESVEITLDTIAGFFTRGLIGGGDIKAYQAAIGELDVEITQSQSSVEFWTTVIDENATAANDAAEAARKLAEATAEGFAGEAERAMQYDRMTREAREKQILQNENDISILNRLAAQAGRGSEAWKLLTDDVERMTIATDQLKEVMTSTADLLDRERQFRDNAAKALQDLNDAMQDEAVALERAAEIRRAIAQLETDTAEKRREAVADAEERRNEIIADGAERRQEIETDDAERRAEIVKRFNADYNNAIGERDALAAYKAKQTRDEELDKQSKAYRKQLDQLEKQMEKQLRAVDKGLDRQLRSINQAYERQLRTLQQSLAEQNALAENARQLQINAQRSYNALIAQAELMHRAAQFKTIYDYGEMTGVYLSNLWRRIAEGARNLLDNPNAPGVGSVGGPDSGVFPGAGTGGNLLNSSFRAITPGLGEPITDPRALLPVNLPPMSGRSGLPGSGARLPSISTYGGNRTTTITFAPVINGSRLTKREFAQMSDEWFDRLHREIRR